MLGKQQVGWVDKWTEGWKDRQMDGWMDGQMNKWMDMHLKPEYSYLKMYCKYNGIFDIIHLEKIITLSSIGFFA